MFSAPVVTVMVDMAPFTGGCHYSYGCENFAFGCGKCPALNSSTENDLSRKTFLQKRDSIEELNITYVASSTPLLLQAQSSA